MQQPAESIGVLVVDDHEVVRRGLYSFLDGEPDIDVLGDAAGGAEALALLASLDAQGRRPDVVVMDVRMPVMDGVEATRRLAATDAGTGPKVLVLTTFDADEHVVEALRAGASGFLLKDVDPADFVLRDFSPTERKELAVHVDRAADAAAALVGEGLLPAQNAFNS